MNFEDLQKNWQAQPVNDLAEIGQLKAGFESQWKRNQRKELKKNIFLSIAFTAVLVIVGWVYVAFQHQYGWPFVVSIASLYVLLLVFLFVSWQSVGFKKENSEVSSKEYIHYQLKKLHWQRKIITTYLWIYTVLLSLTLAMYIWEVTSRGTATFRLTALAVTLGYVLGVTMYTRFFKQKKQLAELQQIITDLKQIQNNLP